MPRAVLIVMSSPSDPSQETEYNEWYSSHLDEVKQVPGIVDARRYRLSPTSLASTPAGGLREDQRYLAIYDLDSDDLPGIVDQLAERSSTGVIQLSDALQRDPGPTAVIYEHID